LDELQELIDNPDETDDMPRLGLHRLPIREIPLLRSLAAVLASYDGPPNSNVASTSSSPHWPPHCPSTPGALAHAEQSTPAS
jgi:hypothetical protein